MLKRKTDISKESVIPEDIRQPAAGGEVACVKSLLRGEKVNIVSFNLLKNEYAFEISDAVEVLKCRRLTAVPRTPEFVKGILSVRGEIVPVIDLKKRLGVGSSEECKGKILIAAIEDLKAGFIVDRLSGVQEVPLNSIVLSNGSEDGGSETSLYVDGIISVNGKTISLLNLGKLIDISGER